MKQFLGIWILFSLAICAIVAQADVLVFQEDVSNTAYATTSDCWITSQNPTSDMGQHSQLRAHPAKHVLIAFRDIIGVATGQIPPGAGIDTATLKLYVTTNHAGGYEANAYRVLKDWADGSEGTEPWNDIDNLGEFGTNWTNATEIFGGSVVPWETAGCEGATDRTQTSMDYIWVSQIELPAGTLGWIEINIAEAVQAWANGEENYGVFLKTSSANLYFASGENGTDALNPILEVHFDTGALGAAQGVHEFQEGISGGTYGMCSDGWMNLESPDQDMGQHTGLRITEVGGWRRRVAMVAFRDIIGGGALQIPPGSVIESATLELSVKNYWGGGMLFVYQLQTDWANGSEGTEPWGDIDNPGEFGCTWNNSTSIFGGAATAWQLPGGEGLGDREMDWNGFYKFDGSDTTPNTYYPFDVTENVQRWADGEPNYGVMISSIIVESANIEFYSSENVAAYRPRLTVVLKGVENVPLKKGWATLSKTQNPAGSWSNCLINWGGISKTVAEATAAGWISGTLYYFDEATQSYKTVPGDGTTIEPDYGYWVWSFINGLSVTIR